MSEDESRVVDREAIKRELADGSSAGGSPLEVGDGENHAAKVVKLSETALKLDSWDVRRGQELLAESEAVRQAVKYEGDARNLRTKKERQQFQELALQVADFHASVYQYEPQLADNCRNPALSEYMKDLMETADYQAIHATTCGRHDATELATAMLANGWVTLCSQENPSDLDKMRCVNNALKEAGQSVKELQDAKAALGLQGIGKLFKKVKGSPRLKQIVDLAGRYRRLAQARQRKKVLHGRDDVVGVELSGDVARATPSELASLVDPVLEWHALSKFSEQQLMSRKYEGIEPQAKGPIVVIVDESGSMDGGPVENAKAIALALAHVAMAQKRYVCLVGFAGGNGGTFCVIPPGGMPRMCEFGEWRGEDEVAEWKESEDALLDWLEHFYGGGTTCDVPLNEVPMRWVELGCPVGKTDMIVITDAQVRVPVELQQSFLAWKQAQNVKLYTLVLNHDVGDMGLVSDVSHKIQALSVEEEAVGEVLSV